MSKRYYLCDVIGTGQEIVVPGVGVVIDAYRPAIADLPGLQWTAVIPSNPDGSPKFSWCLVLAASKDHTGARAHAKADAMPDFPLDGKVNGIETAAKAQMKAAMTRRGLNANAIVDGRDGYREVIRALGQELVATFSEDKFDVTDV